jgi:hypothetical protein
MSAITLEQAQAQLTAWLAASAATATGKSYTMQIEGNSRTMTRNDADEILKMINYWRAEVTRLTPAAARRPRSRYIRN